jgi:hypothetical protein
MLVVHAGIEISVVLDDFLGMHSRVFSDILDNRAHSRQSVFHGCPRRATSKFCFQHFVESTFDSIMTPKIGIKVQR